MAATQAGALPTGTVTFLLTDIEKSTALWERYGDEMNSAVERHETIIRSSTHRHGGTLIRSRGEGDSCFCVFARATEAVAAAIDAQLAMDNEAWSGPRITVRMALHSGTAELRDGQYYGAAVNRCARLRSIGHGGQTLISSATEVLVRDQLPPGVSVVDLGTHRLRDLAQPERVHQLTHRELREKFPALASLEAYPNNLPVQLTTFVGRQRELAELKMLLGSQRLVTLVGPGGSGKTRLSLQAGADLLERFPDGVWLAPLAAVEDPALVVVQVASSLAIREDSARDLLESVAGYLETKRALLILDNCEHVVDAAAGIATSLLARCPDLRMLATSRQALAVPGEVALQIRPLSVPDDGTVTVDELMSFEGVQLLAERACLVRTDFRVTPSNAAAIAQICRSLDGIPLAIELAAARLGALGPAELARRIGDRFDLLGRRAGPERHQTLEAAMDWSYELLDDAERLLFRRLGVFGGRFTLDGAEAICTDDALPAHEVAGLLARLVDRSLVYAETTNAFTTYRMLSTIRAFALSHLASAGEEHELRDRHLHWFVHLADRAEPELVGAAQAEWLERLDADRDNIWAALAWGLESQPQAALRLTANLGHFWDIRGHMTEARRWFDQAIAAAREPSVHLAKALSWAGNLAHEQGDETEARPLLERAFALQRELGDSAGEALTLTRLGMVAQALGDDARAEAFFEAGLKLSRDLGEERRTIGMLVNLAVTARVRGQNATARALFSQALALSRQVGHDRGVAGALTGLGGIAQSEGDISTARAFHADALALFQKIGDVASTAGTLSQLGAVALMDGDHTRAAALFEQALGHYRVLGRKRDVAFTLSRIGTASWIAGDLHRATIAHTEALEIYRELVDVPSTAAALMSLGRISRSAGDHDGALSLVWEAIETLRTYPRSRVMATCLEELAGLTVDTDPSGAPRLLGAADALRHEIGATGPRSGGARYERDVAAAREAVGPEEFDRAWQEGRSMSAQDVVLSIGALAAHG